MIILKPKYMSRWKLKYSFRLLARNKTFSLINIIGLAIGTLCCLYILLYVADQYRYDRQYQDDHDIYRITTSIAMAGDQQDLATASPPIAPAMKNDFGEVVQYTRMVNTIGVKEHLLTYQDRSFYEDKVVYVDSTFFNIFTFHFVSGQAAHALEEPYSIVLRASLARKLFGPENPVGKSIQIKDVYGDHPFKVTGVIDDRLGKTSMDAQLFVSMNSGGFGDFVRSDKTWSGNNFTYSFVKLRPGTSPANLEKKLPAFLTRYGDQQLKTMGMKKVLMLEPVSAIHTTPGYKAEMAEVANPTFLKLLLLIAGMIQLIACINFMNLSTARSAHRAREVGVRKAIGARRADLVRLFLGESFMMALAGVVVALPLLFIFRPLLNRLTAADIPLTLLTDVRLLGALGGLVLLTSLVAGFYPACYLSAFRAVRVLKGDLSNRLSVTGLRHGLVVFQFLLSIVLITGIVIIHAQMRFVKDRNLGFDKGQKLIFSFYTGDDIRNAPTFEASLRQLASVKEVTQTNNYPGQMIYNDMTLFVAGKTIADAKDLKLMVTDEHFLKTLNIPLVHGRDFLDTDSGRVIINQTAARELGLDPRAAIGTILQSPHGANMRYKIVGVMKDFNFSSLYEPVKPFMLMYGGQQAGLSYLVVSMTQTDYRSLLKRIEPLWHQDFPETPFTYAFLDQEFAKQYEKDFVLSRIINSFTLIAILVSCLGLFGLAAFSAEKRKKEIGVRKVLGAGTFHITRLLSAEFMKLVVLALLFSVPVAWWAMAKWLEGFAYHISIHWWMFAVSGGLALVIALATVSLQTFRAARANPAESLKEA